MRVTAPIGGTVVVAGLWVRTEAAANTTLPACPLRAGVKTKTLSPRLRAQALLPPLSFSNRSPIVLCGIQAYHHR